MAEHTITIKNLETFDAASAQPSPLGVASTIPPEDPPMRATIDVDDTVTDWWHYFAPEALVTRMDIYGLATEQEAVEALLRELVRGWDQIAPPRYGGADVGIVVIWATGVAKAAEAELAKHADRLARFRDVYHSRPAVEETPPTVEEAPPTVEEAPSS
jgi:hypothetical protein